mgnify:CR=1 FL=1
MHFCNMNVVFAKKEKEVIFGHNKFEDILELWRLTQNHSTIIILSQPPMSDKR